MKVFVIGILISISCSTLVGCKSRQRTDYLSLTGSIAVQFADKKSAYKWNFTRSVNKKLDVAGQTHYNDVRLISLQINQQTLAGLDYKNSRLIFFDSTLNRTGSFMPNRNDTIAGNKGILYFEYWNDSLFLYDFGSRSLKKYTIPGSTLLYRRQLSDSAGIYRAGHLTGDNYIYTQPRDSIMDMEFILFDALANRITAAYSLNELMHLSSREDYPGMAYDGNFVTNSSSNYLVYYCSFAGAFFCFNRSDGTFAFWTRTIDKTPAPKAAYVDITPKNKSLEIYPNIMFFPSATLYNNELYLLNTINESGDYIIDIYDLNNKGIYRESVFVPRNGDDAAPVSIAAHGNTLYVLYKDQSITKYAINNF